MIGLLVYGIYIELKKVHYSLCIIGLSKDYLCSPHLNNIYSEIDQSSTEISEEIEKCKGSVFERRKELEVEKEIFQTAAYAVIDMLGK